MAISQLEEMESERTFSRMVGGIPEQPDFRKTGFLYLSGGSAVSSMTE